jgi:hypothetical protein
VGPAAEESQREQAEDEPEHTVNPTPIKSPAAARERDTGATRLSGPDRNLSNAPRLREPG